jgi:hypothetical protein
MNKDAVLEAAKKVPFVLTFNACLRGEQAYTSS